MKFAEDKDTESYLIARYGEGEVQVNEVVYSRSLVVMPGRVIADWSPQRIEELAAAHIEELIRLSADILVLGTGHRLQFPSPALTTPVLSAGTGLEVMDTGSACRTYNVLASEGRRVAAALMMI